MNQGISMRSMIRCLLSCARGRDVGLAGDRWFCVKKRFLKEKKKEREGKWNEIFSEGHGSVTEAIFRETNWK